MQEVPIVLIGHKDHGKSTLIGRLILDSGSIKESRLEEIKKTDKSLGKEFELAHLVDSFEEEREREMTMDTARALLKGKKRDYQLIDVPGHAELISNMLTGASNAEAAILLVSAEEGIKEQTIDHLEVANLLGIKQLGVAINKMDRFGYGKEKFEELVERLKKILSKVGYFPEKVYFFPISAKKGDNVVRKSERMDWYKGETIMDFLENRVKKPESFENLPLIFLVQDKYSEDEGIFIVGKVEGGIMEMGGEVLVLPEGRKSEIKLIKDSEGKLERAKTGENVGLVLEDRLEIGRGSVISSLSSKLKVANVLSGEIFWIEKPEKEKLVLECGTAQVKGELKKPGTVNQGEKTNYKILLEKPIVFEPKGRTILGKIALKDKGKIIAIGNIRDF